MNTLAEAAGVNNLGQRKTMGVSGFSGNTNDGFACPFLVTAAAVSENQDWINSLWNYSGFANHYNNWYADYYKLICMIAASGNYWRPEAVD